MHVSVATAENRPLSGQDLPDTLGHADSARAAPKRHDGNFVTGCLIGGAIATVLWAAIGFAAYSLL